MIVREELEELYIKQKKTQEELAVVFNCSVSTVRNYLRKYGISKKIKLSDKFSEIEEEIRSVNPGAKLLKLSNSSEPCLIQCSCGNNFERRIGVIRKYKTCLCYDCTGWKGATNGHREADVRAYIEETGCKLLSPYEHIDKKLTIRCSCGKEFKQTYSVFRVGEHRGCTDCFHKKSHDKQRYSAEQVHAIVQEAGCEWVSGEYKNLKTKLGITCFSCKEEHLVSLDKFVYQHKIRCNKCTTNRSTYELYVEFLLNEMGVDFLMDKHIKGAIGIKGGQLRFDFIIMENGEPSKVIEVDGMQHYRVGGNKKYFNEKQKFEERMENDRLKESFAIEQNLPMLRLSYKLFRSAKKKKQLLETLETFIREDTKTSIQLAS